MAPDDEQQLDDLGDRQWPPRMSAVAPLLSDRSLRRRRISVEAIQRLTGVFRLEPEAAPIDVSSYAMTDDATEPPEEYVTFNVAPGGMFSAVSVPRSSIFADAMEVVTSYDFPDDLIFSYRRGEIPHTEAFKTSESFARMLQKIPAVFVLQIQKGMPAPATWISTLRQLKRRYQRKFHFVCVNTVDAPSSGMLYINGKVDSFFDFLHNSSLISSPQLLDHRITERIALSGIVGDVRRAVSSTLNDASGATSVQNHSGDASSAGSFSTT